MISAVAADRSRYIPSKRVACEQGKSPLVVLQTGVPMPWCPDQGDRIREHLPIESKTFRQVICEPGGLGVRGRALAMEPSKGVW